MEVLIIPDIARTLLPYTCLRLFLFMLQFFGW
jgi:hypothetical protein